MQTTKPDKRNMHACMDQRTHPEQDDPPPTPDDIRRELGWGVLPHSNDDTDDQP